MVPFAPLDLAARTESPAELDEPCSWGNRGSILERGWSRGLARGRAMARDSGVCVCALDY